MRALLAGGLGWLLLAQTGGPLPSWEDLLKQFAAQAFPVLLGFVVHWLGVRVGGKTSAAPEASQSGP